MPLFDLRCQVCGEEFSKITSFSNLPEVSCPKCGKKNNERIYKTTGTGPINRGTNNFSSGFT